MKRNTLLAAILLCTTLFLIVGLQLHSLFEGYKSEQEVFLRKINDGLKSAVNTSFQEKRVKVIAELEEYLNDTTKVNISGKWSEKNETTIFTIADVDTSKSGQHRVSFSKEDIPERIDSVTPSVRKKFIASFTKDVAYELQKGSVWYYTQNIGDLLHERYFKTPIPLTEIEKLYRKKLDADYVFEPFLLSPTKVSSELIATRKVNSKISRIGEPEYVQAFFKNPYAYIIRKQVISLLGSALLIVISVFTFAFMLKTLLSQQKLSEQKDQLITNITHELKTPLTTIQITAEAIKDFDLCKEEQENYLNIILSNTKNLDKITTEILTEARAGQLVPDFESVNISGLVNNLNSSDIEIINNVDSDITLTTDIKLLAKVLNNLVDNAAKYNENQAKKVVISTEESPSSIYISVKDNGIGIPTAHKENIFERFYRIPTKDIHDVRGYGIGLSYVKQVMKILGGEVRLKESSTAGSTFSLNFPK